MVREQEMRWIVWCSRPRALQPAAHSLSVPLAIGGERGPACVFRHEPVVQSMSSVQQQQAEVVTRV